jgi:hypothetical protein
MAKPVDPAVIYPLLLTALRTEPGNLNAAAKHAGVTWNTAQKAWEKGSKKHGFPPLKQVIEQEQIKARALLEAERRSKLAAIALEKEQAREGAVAARKQEGQMTQLVRASSLLALRAVTSLSREAVGLAETINKRIEQEKKHLDLWIQYDDAVLRGDPSAQLPPFAHPPSLNNLLSILNRTADYAGKITHCARQAMDMERIHLGEPTHIIGIADATPKDITLDEVQIRRDNAVRALEGATRSGGLRVIQGGNAEPVIGQRVVVR